MWQRTGCRCPVPLILAATVPECSAAADSLPALNPGALSSHVGLHPHIAYTSGVVFTVGTEHANLPPAQIGDAADHSDLSGLFSEISGNWPVALARASQIHAAGHILPAARSSTWTPTETARKEPGASDFASVKMELKLRGP